jgi:hypothetical protein
MIYIIDDFLDKELLNRVTNSLKDFKKVITKEKDFWTIKPSDKFVNYMVKRLCYEEDSDIKNILCFFRESKKDQDNDWRIHNDSHSAVYSAKPDRALVLFMSDNKSDNLNGTAFWEHNKYGDTFPKDSSEEEANRMLKKDANNLSKWRLKSVIGHKKNRLISYPCEYFHSKYPNEFINSRKVFVMFYTAKR